MNCPNCGDELEDWVTKKELPKVDEACKFCQTKGKTKW